MALLFHVDESADTSHHFHVGLLVDGAGAATAASELDDLVERMSDVGACRSRAEMHAKEIFDRKGDWRSASVAQSVTAFRESLAILGQASIEVLARGVDVPRFEQRYGRGADPYRWIFSNLLERLNERLEDRDEYAVVIADHHQYRGMLQRDVVDARRVGTGAYRAQRLDRILDTAHFVDSKLSRLTQLADIVAFVARRRHTVATESDPRAEAVMAGLMAQVMAAVPSPSGQYFSVRRDARR